MSGVSANHHSSIITAFILFFILTPTSAIPELLAYGIIIVIAVMSKYVLVFRGQHIFNAAALALLLATVLNIGAGSWWVATPYMLLPTLLAGSLVVTKVRKWLPVTAFVAMAFATFVFEEYRFGNSVGDTWLQFFTVYPAIFLAGFMFTEPFAMPARRRAQIFYGLIVGFLFSTSVFLPWVVVTPEMALLIGNIVAYPGTLRRKLKLEFIERNQIARSTYEFVFKKPKGLHFVAGQYLEWMLPHKKADNRGTRRYFTIASAPKENVLRLALKISEGGSSFKQKMYELKKGEIVIASQLAGDFILPKNVHTKLGFIAGGIGVTPFCSHLLHLTEQKQDRDVVMFYCANTKDDLAYSQLFSEASKMIRFKMISVLAKEVFAENYYETGYFNSDIVRKHASDYLGRVWYISGPPLMVDSAEKYLLALGVKRRQIVKDFFPGLS
jgi:ferredoxin-NADP reductase